MNYSIHRLHRDEYGTVLWTTEYGPYTKEQADRLAAEFEQDYGYECVVHCEDKSMHN
jgi:hypothetical protein